MRQMPFGSVVTLFISLATGGGVAAAAELDFR